MPFATVHLEIFHCTHHPVIPKTDLYIYFLFYLKCIVYKNIKVTINGSIMALGNGMSPSTPLNGCEINVRFCFA